MSVLDILIIIPLAWGAFMGFRKGFFREAASLAGLIIGIYLAGIAAFTAVRIMEPIVDWNPVVIQIVAFVVIFLVITLLFSLLGRLLTSLFKALLLNMINRIVGIGFGILKYALVLSLLFIFLNYINKFYPVISDQAKEESFLYGFIEPWAPVIIPHTDFLIPDDLIEPEVPPMQV